MERIINTKNYLFKTFTTWIFFTLSYIYLKKRLKYRKQNSKEKPSGFDLGNDRLLSSTISRRQKSGLFRSLQSYSFFWYFSIDFSRVGTSAIFFERAYERARWGVSALALAINFKKRERDRERALFWARSFSFFQLSATTNLTLIVYTGDWLTVSFSSL